MFENLVRVLRQPQPGFNNLFVIKMILDHNISILIGLLHSNCTKAGQLHVGRLALTAVEVHEDSG